jgi:hypothetical protein
MTTTPSATNPAGPPPPNMPATPPASCAETLVREALDDIALVIGGAAAIHHLDDDLVWTVMKRLDRIRVRLLRDLKGLTPHDDFELNPAWPPRIHAAVDEFLVRSRTGMGE